MRRHVRADINIEEALCLIRRLVFIPFVSGRFLETMRKTHLLATARSSTDGVFFISTILYKCPFYGSSVKVQKEL